MDDADISALRMEKEEEFRRKHLEAMRVTPKASKICKDCGIKLQKHRKEYGLCIDCATDREIRSKSYKYI